ncbi:unnamed protein product [Adineta steineri]|uniref:EF-hand domain-containing protein n=1 Tax=Adineta steineri TaxID=433720 RepID=A0A818HB80_9BILA|nr:unnamed protein product [Adineta steineri]
MAWTYENWILCNVFSGFAIFLLTFIILGILVWHFESIFYAMVDKLFNIQRCVIDVHHTIIRNNSAIYTSKATIKKSPGLASNLRHCCRQVAVKNSVRPDSTSALASDNVVPKLYNSVKNDVLNIVEERTTTIGLKTLGFAETDSEQDLTDENESDQEAKSSDDHTMKSGVLLSTGSTIIPSIPRNHPSHPQYERKVLNVYGKYLTLNKKRNTLLIMVFSTIVISAIIIAGFGGCILASTTIYQNSPCPNYGTTECFHGDNHTYFECEPGDDINITLLTSSASCFRWIVLDKSITDVLTQIAVCTALLTAFGSVAEVILRLLLYVFQPRRGVATGIRRIMEKTVGINRITQPPRFCGATLPCRFGVLNLGLYQHPWLIVVLTTFYILLPLIIIAAFISLTEFQISITSLTYTVLLTLVLLCSLALIWIMWEEDELSRILPGGWMSISDVFPKDRIAKLAYLGTSIVPQNQVTKVTDGISDKGQKVTSMIIDKLPKTERNPIEDVVETVSEKTQSYKQRAGLMRKTVSRSENKQSEDSELHSSKITSSIRANNGTKQARKQTQLTSKTLAILQEATKFSEKDIQAWHAGFFCDCPDGQLTKEIFIRIFKRFYVRDNRAACFCKYVFGMFDKDNSGALNFVEFLLAISSKTQGDLEQRLELAFDMYDVSGNGEIELEELTNLIISMYDLVGETNRKDDKDPKFRAIEIFKKLDINNDKKLSKEEFIKAWKNTPDLVHMLAPQM